MKKIISLLFALAALNSFGAFTEAFVQTTGSNLNAGILDSGDTGAPDDAASVTLTGGNWVQSTGVFTSAGSDLSSIAVGEFASVYASGATETGFVGRITAVDDTLDTVTVSLAISSGSAPANGTGDRALKVGGAWAGPSGTVGFPFGFAAGTMINANSDPLRVNIKGGTTYEVTAPMTHAVNGVIFEGYTTTAGDGGMAKIGGDSASPSAPYTILTISGAGNKIRRIWFDDNGGTTGGQAVGNNAMFDITSNGNLAEFCRFSNAYRIGARLGGGGSVISDCEAYSCQRDDAQNFGGFQGTASGKFIRCVSYNHVAGTDSIGFCLSSNDDRVISLESCISLGNGGNGFQANGTDGSIHMKKCISYGNAEIGIHFDNTTLTTSLLIVEDTITYGNDFGITNDSAMRTGPIVRNCAFGDNTSGDTSNVPVSFIINKLTLTADPFVDGPNGDFRLNTTSGGGALLRAAGIGTWFIDASVLTASDDMIAYPDVGPNQHQDAGGAAVTTAYSSAN